MKLKSCQRNKGVGHVNRNEGSGEARDAPVGQTLNSSQKFPALRNKRWSVNLAAGLPSGHGDKEGTLVGGGQRSWKG